MPTDNSLVLLDFDGLEFYDHKLKDFIGRRILSVEEWAARIIYSGLTTERISHSTGVVRPVEIRTGSSSFSPRALIWTDQSTGELIPSEYAYFATSRQCQQHNRSSASSGSVQNDN